MLLRKKWLLAILASFLIGTPPTFPAEIQPFYTQNQSPLVQIFGLPFIGNPRVLPKGKGDVRLTVDLANTYIQDSNPKESILLDGESTRITVDARYGILTGFEVGIAVPYIIQGGGFLDDFLIDYHNAFGFPQGGREQAPRNRLLYQYQKGRQSLLNVNQSGNGIGDLQLNGGYQLYESPSKPSRAVALRSSLKLPTGDSDGLRGSGSTDVALWLVAGDDYGFSRGRIGVFGAAGIMGMTEGNVLPDQQRNAVGFGALGIGWSPLRWLTLKVQANAHTSFYKQSDLRELNLSSVQLTMGGTLAFTEKISLDLGVTEDVVVNTSPDVVFHVSLMGRF
ncbi:MAG TPA: DUF3187 family protein [Thermodesulfobacteriota bacterium]|nr:DUF3187 family protein [Thermodesulfobacteriota bacterium]